MKRLAIQVLKLIYKRHKHCETKVAERWDSNWYGVFPIDLTDRGISILLSITITLWRKLTSEVIVSMKLAGFSSNFVRLNEDNHARSQEFLRVFVLRTYPAFCPRFWTATQLHLLFSIKYSAVSNPFVPEPPDSLIIPASATDIKKKDS
jgi:hypothetical protein